MIRHLAQSMSKPTLKAWTELRHFVQYLLGCTGYGLMMHYRSDFDGSDFLLKTYTDSDLTGHLTRAHARVFLLVVL